MKLAHNSVILVAALIGCSRAPVCELEFRVGPGQKSDSDALASTCEVLRARLENSVEASGFRVATSSGSSLVITLTRPLDDTALAQLRSLVERRGRLQFLAVADAQTADFDEASERGRCDAWRAAHAGADVAQFNQLARDAGGPLPSIEWHLERAPVSSPGERYAMACERATDSASTFTGADLERAYPEEDQDGFPAVRIGILDRRRAEFAAFTARCVRRRIAIVYEGEVITAPTVRTPLSKSAMIEGHYEQGETDALCAILNSGELPLALEFVELRKLR